MPPSPFSVAGMASTSTSHHNHPHTPNLNAWGTASTSGSFTDTLSQSRSHYQPGYLMSVSQSNNSPTGAQRVDEARAPVVQTKAKMNSAFSRSGPAADFGMDSMFQSSRQRQTLADEDAPPMSSVNDIPTEMYADAGSGSHFQPRASSFRARPSPAPHSNSNANANSTPPTLHILVFGYPPDKYTLTVAYFRALGDTNEPQPHGEVTNCFRLGFREPAAALRAVRKNGDVLGGGGGNGGGGWMVGVKWADPAQADALLARPISVTRPLPTTTSSDDMAVDTPNSNSGTPAYVGTPIKLAPAASAFRGPAAKGNTPRRADDAPKTAVAGEGVAVPAAGKGVLGQVGDMIFGW